MPSLKLQGSRGSPVSLLQGSRGSPVSLLTINAIVIISLLLGCGQPRLSGPRGGSAILDINIIISSSSNMYYFTITITVTTIIITIIIIIIITIIMCVTIINSNIDYPVLAVVPLAARAPSAPVVPEVGREQLRDLLYRLC